MNIRRMNVVFIMIISIMLVGCSFVRSNQRSNDEKELISINYFETVDGDTAKFEIDGEIKTIRFLAVDCPESVHPTKEVEKGGVEASEFTKNVLSSANKIEIEFDSESNREDKYGRLLAWVWIDGELLQEKLIENGHAKTAYVYGDYKYIDRLKWLEKQ